MGVVVKIGYLVAIAWIAHATMNTIAMQPFLGTVSGITSQQSKPLQLPTNAFSKQLDQLNAHGRQLVDVNGVNVHLPHLHNGRRAVSGWLKEAVNLGHREFNSLTAMLSHKNVHTNSG
jgi:hypothetical protein